VTTMCLDLWSLVPVGVGGVEGGVEVGVLIAAAGAGDKVLMVVDC